MDICVFCTKAWLPKHAGVSVRYSNAAGEQVEEKIAAPQSLANMIAHLSTSFRWVLLLLPVCIRKIQGSWPYDGWDWVNANVCPTLCDNTDAGSMLANMALD